MFGAVFGVMAVAEIAIGYFVFLKFLSDSSTRLVSSASRGVRGVYRISL